jgi:hypothetical protein
MQQMQRRATAFDRQCRQLGRADPDRIEPAIYESIDLTQWIAGYPADVLATNSARRRAHAKFSHRDVFVTGKGGPELELSGAELGFLN